MLLCIESAKDVLQLTNENPTVGPLEYGDSSSISDVVETSVSKQGLKRSSSAAEYANDNVLDSGPSMTNPVSETDKVINKLKLRVL